MLPAGAATTRAYVESPYGDGVVAAYVFPSIVACITVPSGASTPSICTSPWNLHGGCDIDGCVGVAVGAEVGVASGVRLAVGSGVAVGVAVSVGSGVAVSVGAGVGVGVASSSPHPMALKASARINTGSNIIASFLILSPFLMIVASVNLPEFYRL